MSTPITVQRTRFDDNAEVRWRLSHPLVHAQTTGTGPSRSSLVGAWVTIHSTSATPLPEEILRLDSVELQWFDRYSQQILVLACMLVGCVLRDGANPKIGKLIRSLAQRRHLGVVDQWIR